MGPVAAGKLTDIGSFDRRRQGDHGGRGENRRRRRMAKSPGEGVYTGFSQGGRYVKRWTRRRDRANPATLRNRAEISLVDLPCMPGATFQGRQGSGRCRRAADFGSAGAMGSVPGRARETADRAICVARQIRPHWMRDSLIFGGGLISENFEITPLRNHARTRESDHAMLSEPAPRDARPRHHSLALTPDPLPANRWISTRSPRPLAHRSRPRRSVRCLRRRNRSRATPPFPSAPPSPAVRPLR